ncbi:MAG: RagB/SusD family nutrient uptake outer membrane protein [Bacteroidota bacterium]
MKMKVIFSIMIITLLGLSSCNDYLEPEPRDRYSEMIAWKNYDNAKLYLNSFYKNLREYGSVGSSVFGGRNTDGLTDILKYGSNVPGEGNANVYAFEPSRISPDQNALGIWGDAYEKIRRINEFLEGLKEYADFEDEEETLMEAQARFVRGYIYHLLMARHGSVILLDETTTERDHSRSPADECWDFIADDLNFAAENLPEEWPDSEEGRITKGAAYAMLSRVMLYAERWDDAIAAAESVMDLADEGLYELAENYEDAFESRADGNQESILEFYYDRPDLVHQWDYNFAPGGDNPGHGGKATPTQDFVEEFETEDGQEVDWSEWHAGATNEEPPYEDLEPRFHATVLYNGAEWKGREIEPFVGGVDGFMDFGFDPYPNGKTTTGYFLKKYLDEDNTNIEKDKSEQPIIEIRYAEVLLNYAEACARSNRESDANNAIQSIRNRVGLPYSSLSGDELIQQIRKERKIELAFEGHRYWDLRRWERAHIELNDVRFSGMKILDDGENFIYQVVDCDGQDRQFLERLYNFPIPSSEIANNRDIEQIEPW